MNIRMLVYILGKVLLIEGVLMLLPILCGLFYGEGLVLYYVALAAIYVGAGFLIMATQREGYSSPAICDGLPDRILSFS